MRFIIRVEGLEFKACEVLGRAMPSVARPTVLQKSFSVFELCQKVRALSTTHPAHRQMSEGLPDRHVPQLN